jgi:DNA polymerase III epsilon subunit-like protein
MFKVHCPGLPSYKQKYLVDEYLATATSYDAHNALADVLYLRELFNQMLATRIQTGELNSYSYTTKSALDKSAFLAIAEDNMPTYKQLIAKKVVSKDTAMKLSGHNIRYDHLTSLYSSKGEVAVRELFNGQSNGIACLSSEIVIGKIITHLNAINKK